MNPFKRLMITDILNVRTPMLAAAGLFIVANIALFILQSWLTAENFLGWFEAIHALSLAASIIVPLVLSFSIWNLEWKGNHQLLFLPLPVPKSYIFFSKFSVILLVFVLLVGISAFFFILENSLFVGLPNLLSEILTGFDVKAAISTAVSLCVTVLLIFFSVLLGRSVRRFSGFLTFLAFVILLNVPSLITYLFEPTAEQASTVVIGVGGMVINGEPVLMLPLFINILLGALYLAGSLQLLNKRIEA